MIMESPPFEDVVPIENRCFPVSHVSFFPPLETLGSMWVKTSTKTNFDLDHDLYCFVNPKMGDLYSRNVWKSPKTFMLVAI